MRRIAILDLSRGIAALIVFLGHFLAQDQHFQLQEDSVLYKFLETRHFCVLYFFALSGYVLMKSIKNRTAGISWLGSRLVRLYPVYLTCWLVPYIGLRALGSSEIQLDWLGTLLGFFGLQSWTLNHYLDGPNSPLWSLSVEIALSFFLLIIVKARNYIVFIPIIILIAIYDFKFELIPVLSGLPYFMTGVVLSKFEPAQSIHRFLRFVSPLAVLFFCVYLPLQFPGFLTSSHPQFSLPAVTSVLILCLTFKVPNSIERVARYIGTRSFAMYACHVPTLWLYKRIVFGPTKGSSIESANIFYFVGGFLLVLLVTEILYRTVDLWAIGRSHDLRNRPLITHER